MNEATRRASQALLNINATTNASSSSGGGVFSSSSNATRLPVPPSSPSAALGFRARAIAPGSIAAGVGCVAGGNASVAVGADAYALAPGSARRGAGAVAAAAHAVALPGAVATEAWSLVARGRVFAADLVWTDEEEEEEEEEQGSGDEGGGGGGGGTVARSARAIRAAVLELRTRAREAEARLARLEEALDAMAR